MSVEIVQGDCIERMRAMPASSIDAVVTDPPYGIGFMGHEWDQPGEFAATKANGKPNGGQWNRERRTGQASRGSIVAGSHDLSLSANRRFQGWCEAWATEALRVLKPGGHMVVFGAPRTYHRLAAGIEDAGFEIRDGLMWLFGSGFPKSLDVAKAIDRDARAVARRWFDAPHGTPAADARRAALEERAAVLDVGDAFDGQGTALKPAYEPIVLARKPLAGTVAENALAHGTGPINIDGCRIAHDEATPTVPARPLFRDRRPGEMVQELLPSGRWPATVLLDGTAAVALDEQSGELTSGANPTRRGSDKFRTAYGDFAGQREIAPNRGKDVGGASRFFYVAKASSAERNAGLVGLPADGTRANVHPTVKPVDVMRWLVRLVTPAGGTVLDPFTGSGTTAIAAHLEGRPFVGVEREEKYVELAAARARWWARWPAGTDTRAALADWADEDPARLAERVARIEAQLKDLGQASLFDAIGGAA